MCMRVCVYACVRVQQALFGTSLTMADGVLTPAVSVTSAVSGIAVVKASVAHDIVPISIVSPFLPPLPLPARLVPLPSPLPHSRKRTSLVLPPPPRNSSFSPHTLPDTLTHTHTSIHRQAFLVFLFLIQRVGTSKLAFTFAPITFVWLALLGVTGIVNITKFPGIFRAFDPSRAVLRMSFVSFLFSHFESDSNSNFTSFSPWCWYTVTRIFRFSMTLGRVLDLYDNPPPQKHTRRRTRRTVVFKRTRDYDLLGGILLAVTGCEALFAK